MMSPLHLFPHLLVGNSWGPPWVAVGKVSRECGFRPEQLPLYSLLFCSHGPSRKVAALPQKGANSWALGSVLFTT